MTPGAQQEAWEGQQRWGEPWVGGAFPPDFILAAAAVLWRPVPPAPVAAPPWVGCLFMKLCPFFSTASAQHVLPCECLCACV